ncbi:MAG: hypothetical protein QG654_540 [Patescibacteria group bacterium]|jgi:hypothetical protein|nr:hypothetical protein [Patescibacteria group bacterium]
MDTTNDPIMPEGENKPEEVSPVTEVPAKEIKSEETEAAI